MTAPTLCIGCEHASVAPELYRRVRIAWGDAAQWRMVQEECAELIAAVNRCDRGRIDVHALASEVADVEIMCEQARAMLGDGIVERAKAKKLARLRERVEQHERAQLNKRESAEVVG